MTTTTLTDAEQLVILIEMEIDEADWAIQYGAPQAKIDYYCRQAQGYAEQLNAQLAQ